MCIYDISKRISLNLTTFLQGTFTAKEHLNDFKPIDARQQCKKVSQVIKLPCSGLDLVYWFTSAAQSPLKLALAAALKPHGIPPTSLRWPVHNGAGL